VITNIRHCSWLFLPPLLDHPPADASGCRQQPSTQALGILNSFKLLR
jgi:hypothetical protein